MSIIGYKTEELHNEEGRLASVKLSKIYQSERLDEVMARVAAGEPFGICNVDEVEEVFHAFGFPIIPLQYWSSVISSKRLSVRYFNYMAERGYDQDPYYCLGLACSMAHDPDAPYGGLPTPTVVVGNSGYDSHQAIKELWAKELGAPYFPMEAIEGGMGGNDIPEWWNTIVDGWEEMCNKDALEMRVQNLYELIHFLEVKTGVPFDPDNMLHVADTLNEHMDYMAKVRDLIADARPCPVSLRDQLAMYPITWWRGIDSARDVAKKYYEEVLERLENGTCVYKGEKIRLFWTSQGLWQNTKFYHAFEEKYGAVFVGSMYQSVISDGYKRNHKGDPIRAIAGRNLIFPVSDPKWLVAQAKRHGCHACIGQAPLPGCEESGMPFLNIGGSNVDARGWDEEAIEAMVGKFLEERVIPNLDK